MEPKEPEKPKKPDPHRHKARAARRAGNDKTQPHPKQAERARIRSDMLDMRIAGYTFEQIARDVGKTTKWVQQQLDAVIKQITLPKAEVAKVMMVEQIDRVMPSHYNAAVKGDVGAVHALIALLDRKSRLMGLFEPEKTQHVGADGKPINVIPVLNITIAQPVRGGPVLEQSSNVTPILARSLAPPKAG